MKIKLKIKRSTPLNESEPFFQAFSIDAQAGMTVLEALLKIADEDDPTLSFRKSCRSAICGSCAMTINGHARLACNTQILPEFHKFGEVMLEPLSNHAVLKDLMVDLAPFWEKIERVMPYLTPPDAENTGKMTSEDEAKIDKSQQCIMCGSCNSECNALEIDEHYAGPAALAKAWRFVGDTREGLAEKRLDKLSTEHGMWDCVRCGHCTEYCPKGVAPLKAIELLRSRALKLGITDNHGAKHALSMTNSIKRVGRLDEAAMTFKTLGFLRSLGMIPFGIKMELHGKMPMPLILPQIDGMDEVKTIFEAVEDKNKDKEDTGGKS